MAKKKTGGKPPVKAKTAAKPVVKEIPLAAIVADPEVQARVALSEEVIADYAAAMLEGVKFPRCIVFDDGTTLWLSDGFHRFIAASRTDGKVQHLSCEVHKGTKRDAQLFALLANAAHGLRRTSADKRKAVLVMLHDPEWKQWSAREITRQCAVSPALVDNIRNELRESPSSLSLSLPNIGSDSPTQASVDAPAEAEGEGRKYINKYGSEAKMRTKRKRGARKKEAESSEPEEKMEPTLPDEGEGGEQGEPEKLPLAAPGREGNGHFEGDSLPVADREERPDQGDVSKQNIEREADTSPDAGSGLDELEIAREDIARLTAEKRALQEQVKQLEAKVAELEAPRTGDPMTYSEFQVAIRKFEDLVETQRGIIAKLESENANLRAENANLRAGIVPPTAPQPSEPQSLLQLIEHALSAVERAQQVANMTDRWPDKAPDRERGRGGKDLRDIVTRLRGLRERVELYAEKNAVPERYH